MTINPTEISDIIKEKIPCQYYGKDIILLPPKLIINLVSGLNHDSSRHIELWR